MKDRILTYIKLSLLAILLLAIPDKGWAQPILNPDFYSVDEGGTLNIDSVSGVLANDSNIPQGYGLGIQNEPDYAASFDCENNGSFIYTHDGSENHVDTFIYAINGITEQVEITINPVNDTPVIIGQSILSVQEDNSLTIYVDDLLIDDPDDEYPGDFSLTLNSGDNYSLSGNTITPAANYYGTLTIPATVNDGEANSNSFDLTVTVTAVNDAPIHQEPVPDQTATEDQDFSYTIPSNTFDDDDGDNLTYSLKLEGTVDSLPGWLNFNAATLEMEGTPANDDVGTITLVLTATDDSLATANAEFDLEVVNVNDPPELLNPIENQSVFEDDTVTFVLPDSTFIDIDIGDVLTITADTNETLLSTSGWLRFDENTSTFTFMPLNKHVGTVDILVTATDSEDASVSDTFTLTVINTNDAPTVKNSIPDQTPNEDADFSYQFPMNTFEDVDGDTLTYTALLEDGTPLDETWLDFEDSTRTFIGFPTNEDVGLHVVVVTATDGDDGEVSDTFNIEVINVNDPPTLDHPIPDTSATQGTAFLFTFDENTFSDQDPGDSLIFSASYSATSEGSFSSSSWLSFDGASRTFSGTPENSHVGNLYVRVNARDREGLSIADTFIITVININDPPVGVDDNYTFDEGSSNNISAVDGVLANDYDIDAGDTITAELVDSTFNGTLTLNADGSFTYQHDGSETLIDSFIYVPLDSVGTSGNETPVYLTITPVNDPPVVSDTIPEQVKNEGERFEVLLLHRYVTDPDHNDTTEISWKTIPSSADHFNLDIRQDTLFVAPRDSNWFGIEDIHLVARDLDGLSDTAMVRFQVLPVNDAPVVTIGNAYKPYELNEGGTIDPINLNAFVDDVDDHDSLIAWDYEVSDDTIAVVIDTVTKYAEVSLPNPGWYGDFFIRFEASDSSGLSDSDTAFFSVLRENDSPLISGLQIDPIAEGDSFDSIYLDNYVTDDVDHDSLITWEWYGGGNLSVDITDERILILAAPDSNWYGRDTVWLIATDTEDLSDTARLELVINAVNDPPVLEGIPDQTILEGGTFDSITLTDYVTDVDNDSSEMDWAVESTPTNLVISFTEHGVANISLKESSLNWNGSDTVRFIASDPSGARDFDEVVFTTTPVNDAPVITGIPDISIPESNFIHHIDLSLYSEDIETPLENLSYDIVSDPSSNLSISLDDSLVTITPVDEHWYGVETIIFRVTDDDPEPLSDTNTMIFTVTNVDDYPELADIPDQTINEGQTLDTIFYADYLTEYDNDDVAWSVEGDDALQVVFHDEFAEILIPHVNWNGSEVLTFVVTDQTVNAYSAQDDVIITVQPVDDVPLLDTIPTQVINEGESFPPIPLNDYKIEYDGDNTSYEAGYNNNIIESLTIINDTAKIVLADEYWNVNTTVTFAIQDIGTTDSLSSEMEVLFDVLPVDDAPEFLYDTIDYNGTEDKPIRKIFLGNKYEEYDGDEVTFLPQPDPVFELSIEGDSLITMHKEENWFGERSIALVVQDNTQAGLSDTVQVKYIISPVDDKPYVKNPYPIISVLEDADRTVINLLEVFDDVDNDVDSFEFSIQTIINPKLIEASIDDSNLILSYMPNENGFGGIYVRATNNGQSVTNKFDVAVEEVNDPPTFVNVTGDIIVTENDDQVVTRFVNIDPDPVPADEKSQVVSYTISPQNVDFADISIDSQNGTVTIRTREDSSGVQIFTITADDGQPENNIATEQFTLSVRDKMPQSISFDFIPDKTVLDTFVVLSAAATSGLPVSFSMLGGPATIEEDTLIIQGSGEITVRASQEGNDQYAAAPNEQQSFEVKKITQRLYLGLIPDKRYGDPPFTIEAYSDSGLPVDVEITWGDAVTLTDDTIVTIIDTGKVELRVTQDGNDIYAPGDPITETFYVNRANQSIDFRKIDNRIYSSTPIQLSADASSDLPVSFELVAGSASLDENLLTLHGTGYVTVRAVQQGNALYQPAYPQERTFRVFKASQKIDFDTIYNVAYNRGPVELSATASSGLEVTYAGEGPIEVNGNELILTGVGEATVHALQTGDNRYFPADTVTRKFMIYKAEQEIEFVEEIDSSVFGLDAIDLNAMATSGLDLVYEVISGPAIIRGDSLLPFDYGNIKVRITQPGNDNYKSTSVDVSIVFIESMYDARLVELLFPASGQDITLHRPLDISIAVTNSGNRVFNSMKFTYEINDGDAMITETYYGPFNPGDSIEFTFGYQWTPRKENNTLCVYLSAEPDTIHTNDTICVTLQAVGIFDNPSYLNNIDVKVFPVPAKDYLTFEFPEFMDNGSLLIYDSSGRILKRFDLKESLNRRKVMFDTRPYQQGLYHYVIQSGDKHNRGTFMIY